MADAYWRYNNDPRQPAPPPPVSSLPAKRPRSDFNAPPGRDVSGYYSHDNGTVSQSQLRDSQTINASYDNYLRGGPGGQLPYGASDSGRLPTQPVNDPYMASDPRIRSDPRISGDPRFQNVGVVDPGMPLKGHGSDHNLGRSLPPDASNTLFVEGLPGNCTRREVAHIFRPFVGYKEVRLVTKESRQSRGEPFVLCFVDFVSPAHAATAMDALKGYKFDEHDRDSAILRLQFSRYPGARSGGGSSGGGGGGHRGKR